MPPPSHGVKAVNLNLHRHKRGMCSALISQAWPSCNMDGIHNSKVAWLIKTAWFPLLLGGTAREQLSSPSPSLFRSFLFFAGFLWLSSSLADGSVYWFIFHRSKLCGGFTVYCCDPNVFHRASTQQMLRKQGGEAFLTHVTSLELLQHLSQTKGDGSLRNGALGTTFKFSLSHLLADLGICNSVYP